MLSLARTRLPRIGSLTIDNKAVLSLTNRPLTLQLHQLENEDVCTNIPRELTYTSTDTYLLDLLACHDNRIRHKPNSILSNADAQAQLSALTVMRAVMQHFTSRSLRHGPFALMLTDLHQSNIFVDNDWNITSLIDLGWACSLPVEMLHPPYWLTSRSIDDITEDDDLAAYRKRHGEFMAILEEEEQRVDMGSTDISSTMRAGWDSGNFWYFSALRSFKGLYNLVIQHIQPRYGAPRVDDWEDFERLVAPYWAPGTSEFVSEKIGERDRYLERVKQLFQQSVEGE